jgi:hypothetical protein
MPSPGTTFYKEKKTMRIHVYSQELTKEVTIVGKKADTGITYYGVRFWLASPDVLHRTLFDDDRSAVTFWLPNTRGFTKDDLADLFEQAARLIRNCPDPEPN